VILKVYSFLVVNIYSSRHTKIIMAVRQLILGVKMLEDVLYIEETKVTVRKYRHRTTVPANIFKLLKLKDGDSLKWIAMKDGKILIEKKHTK